MAYTAREVVASAARTASGNSGALRVGGSVSYGPADSISIGVNVSAVSGDTPSMTVSVEWSLDGTNFLRSDPAQEFTAFTAAAGLIRSFTVLAPTYRVVWTITGTTPSFTFSVHELAEVD